MVERRQASEPAPPWHVEALDDGGALLVVGPEPSDHYLAYRETREHFGLPALE